MLYVGGLDEGVTEALVHAAFVPFGNVKEVNLPMDPESSEPWRASRLCSGTAARASIARGGARARAGSAIAAAPHPTPPSHAPPA